MTSKARTIPEPVPGSDVFLTAAHGATASPDATAASEATAANDATAAPGATSASDATAAPGDTVAPGDTAAPGGYCPPEPPVTIVRIKRVSDRVTRFNLTTINLFNP